MKRVTAESYLTLRFRHPSAFMIKAIPGGYEGYMSTESKPATKVGEITIGVVTKVMTHIGYGLFDGGYCLMFLEDYETAVKELEGYTDKGYIIKKMYVEED